MSGLTYRLLPGDCRESMAGMPEASVDAVVCDPPYGLAFMGKGWDHAVPGVEFWTAALRVAKPGAHLVAFGGTRTFHRLTCAIEDAGWEIRDCLSWLYGSGFPKSLDVSKAIDKAAGAQREVVGHHDIARRNKPESRRGDALDSMCGKGAVRTQEEAARITAPATAAACEWSGWGTALKPAWEPVILARKPLRGTVAANVQAHGTGALNIDGCRIGTEVETWPSSRSYAPGQMQPGHNGKTEATGPAPAGRWPANVLLDEEAAAMLDAQSGDVQGAVSNGRRGVSGVYEDGVGSAPQLPGYADSGGASRFFYTAKASRSERNDGVTGTARKVHGPSGDGRVWDISGSKSEARANFHPTVKPVDLMGWLCRLVTPPGGVILDPFMGSGSTGVAAIAGGFSFIGCEIEPEYVSIARARISATCPLLAKEL